MKLIYIVPYILIFSLIPVFANYTCVDNETLHVLIEWNETSDGTTTQESVLVIDDCEWGCDNVTHRCNSNPITRTGIVLVVIISIAVILFIILPKISRG